MIASGGGILGGVNPNGNYSGAVHAGTTLNGDRQLPARRADRHPGDHARRRRRRSRSIRTIVRPYTDEFTGGVDHELFPALRLSVIVTHRVERNPQATSNPANPYDTFLTTRADTGRDGVAGTADDSTFQFYNRTSTAVNQTFFTNDRSFRQTYNGLEITAPSGCRTAGRCWSGYTYSQTRHEGLERQHQPERLDQRRAGPVTGQTGDRPHQFKVTGTYILPFYDIGFAGNFNRQSGARDHAARSTRRKPWAAIRRSTSSRWARSGCRRARRRTCALFKTVSFGVAQPGGVGGLQQRHQHQHGLGRAHAGRHDQPAAERRPDRHASTPCRSSARRRRSSVRGTSASTRRSGSRRSQESGSQEVRSS